MYISGRPASSILSIALLCYQFVVVFFFSSVAFVYKRYFLYYLNFIKTKQNIRKKMAKKEKKIIIIINQSLSCQFRLVLTKITHLFAIFLNCYICLRNKLFTNDSIAWKLKLWNTKLNTMISVRIYKYTNV